jgi:hydrogenase maturation protease
MTGRILVAGVGNIFLGDDGFGVEVANRLLGTPMPDGVEVVDIGIRGVHLAYQLLDGYDVLVLVDAVPRGEAAGTVSVIEPDLTALSRPTEGPPVDGHGMEPAAVLALVATLSDAAATDAVGRVLIVGCEPQVVEEGMGLSPPVAAAIPDAERAVRRLVEELVEERKDHEESDESGQGRRGAGGGRRGGHERAGRQALPADATDVSGRR